MSSYKPFEAKCSRKWKAQKSHHFIIFIEPPNWENYRYTYDITYHGRATGGSYGECKTKQELLALIHREIADWERPNGDYLKAAKLEMKDVYFESFTSDLTLAEVFGAKRLDGEAITAKPCSREQCTCYDDGKGGRIPRSDRLVVGAKEDCSVSKQPKEVYRHPKKHVQKTLLEVFF